MTTDRDPVSPTDPTDPPHGLPSKEAPQTPEPPNASPSDRITAHNPEQPTDTPSPQAPAACAGLAEAIAFLFPIGHIRHPSRASALAKAVPWIIPVGLAIGLLWIGGFRLTWRIYGETQGIRVVPALTIIMIECLFTGLFLVFGLARSIHLLGNSSSPSPSLDRAAPLPPIGTLALCLTVLAQWALILSIPYVTPWWPADSDWRHHLSFLYPEPIYRPLLLAPLWGRWGILMAASIGRTARNADDDTVALCGAMTPIRLLRHTALPCFLTAIYFSREQNFGIGIVMSMLVFGLTFLPTVIMARRSGGQTRHTLFATGQIAQLAFLAIYRAFWPYIHG